MTERPPSLSPEIRALLRGYRDAHRMPEAAKARVHARLDAGVPSHRPAWVWAGVGAAAAGLLVWGALSISGALQSSTAPTPPSQASMPSADTEALPPAVPAPRVAPRRAPPRPAPAPLDPPLPTPTPPKIEPTPKRAPTRPEPSEPAPAPAETPASRLGAENRLIAQTWEHVRAEHYAKAEASLAEHAKSFPSGVLAPERRALEVIVDCLAHPEAAAGKADAYARAGRTTLLAKVRSACAEEKSPPQ